MGFPSARVHNFDFFGAGDGLSRGVVRIEELDQAWLGAILGSLAANIENNGTVGLLDLVSIEY